MQKSFYGLVKIVERLRGRNGCSWDRKQTLKSIRENIIEEAYETVDAINRNDYHELRTEAGDLLLQAVFISQLAGEKGKFTIKDVLDSLAAKLIRRHPHIFNNVKVKNDKELLRNWENIKQAEKSRKSRKDIFSNVPDILPALLKAKKVQSKLERLGAILDTPAVSLRKISQSLKKMRTAVIHKKKNTVKQELAETLFSLIHIARSFDINAEEALNKRTRMFTRQPYSRHFRT
ncbi:MAG: nucleoside triphosphate pyrophosphohydrolase [bacterium]|nr:nucleoside triphosphate pyrophosphohydrolase [bacterium]